MHNRNEAEELFLKWMKLDGATIKYPSREQDMHHHIDLICDGVSYDIKGQKRFNRSDTSFSDVIWIEITNVRGNNGWVRGKADKIAFFDGKEFLIVDREKLLELTREKVKDLKVYNTKGYCKLYRRYGRQDVVTYLYLEDISPIIEKRFSK